MSLTGNAEQKQTLRGRINSCDVLTLSAYGIAVKNGFEGTEEEWLASLKGEPGDRGEQGIQGIQGEKGEPGNVAFDELTEEQKAMLEGECIDYIAEELAKRGQLRPEFANSIEECTDPTKLYVLPDGFIYAYMSKQGATFTNQLENAIDTDGTPFNNGMGYKNGIGINNSFVEANDVNNVASGYIPFTTSSRLLRVAGSSLSIDEVAAGSNSNAAYEYVIYYDESFNVIAQQRGRSCYYVNEYGSVYEEIDAKGVTTMCYTFDWEDLPNKSDWWTSEIIAKAAYVRFFWYKPDLSSLIVTIDEEIAWGVESKWQSTGHQFVPADNEDRIIALEDAKENHESRLKDLEMHGGGSVSGEDIPSYIKSEADDVISRLLEKQGDRCFTMIGLSDFHYSGTGNNKDNLIRASKAISYIQSRIHVDAVATLGDNVPFGVGGDENMETAHRWFKEINEILQMTEGEGVAMFRTHGNHDRLGGNDADGNPTSFMPDDAIYRYVGGYNRDCVMGDVPGGWGYQDFESYKLRIILLNTAECEGVGRFSEFAGYRMSTKQYNWLIDTLDMSGKEDATEWQILILSHHRPDDWQEHITETEWGENGYILPNILHAYSTGGSFTGTRPDGDIISCDFHGKNQAVLIGSIHGHHHAYLYGNLYRGKQENSDLTNVMAVSTPTSGFGAGEGHNDDNDGNWYDSVKDTAEETAFCVYSIDLDNHVIHAIHYGNGIDREISYPFSSDVVDVAFRKGSISTSGGIVEGSTSEMICDGITLDGYDFIDIKLVDSENWNLGLYAIKADGTIIQYNSGNFIYHGTVRCDDPTLEYAIRAKNLGTSDNFTVENVTNSFVISRGKHSKPQFGQEEIESLFKGENLYFPCVEPLYEQTFGTSGYKGDRDNAVTRPISIGDFDGIRFTFSDPGYYYKLYTVNASGTVKTINSAIEAPSEYVFTDKGLKYVLVVDKMGSSANYTQEDMDSIAGAFTLEYFYVNPMNEANTSVYGYSRQYTDISHLLNWERKSVVEGNETESTTAILAELPRWGCFEVKLNDPNTNWFFRVFKHNETDGWAELTDGGCYYAYRQHSDGSSHYYVQVEKANGSTIDVTSAHAIRAFTFEDMGVKHSQHNPNLYGKKIAVIGDSIVQGRFCKFGTTVNMAMAKPWSHHIAESCNVEPANFGIGGARVYNNDWRSLYINCDNVDGYDVVFVCAGTNDYGGNVAEDAFRTAFAHVVETLVANNTEVVVCTPVYRTNKTAANTASLTLSDYATIEKEIAAANGCRVLDLYTLTNNSAFTATLNDGLHPNEVGQKMIADIVLESY